MGVDPERDKESEVVAAEIETRLGTSILRILRPTIDQTSSLEARLDQLAKKVDSVVAEVEGASDVRTDLDEIRKLTDVAATEVKYLKKITYDGAQETDTKIAHLTHVCAELERGADTFRGDLRKQSREIERLHQECERMLATHSEDFDKMTESMSATAKRCDRTVDDVRISIRNMQKQRDDFAEELLGDDGVMAHMRQDLNRLQAAVKSVPDLERDIDEFRVLVNAVTRKTEKVENSLEEAKVVFENLKLAAEKTMVDFSESFRNKSNQLVAHQCTMLKDIRVEYNSEIDHMKSLREELTEMKAMLEARVHKLSNCMEAESQRISMTSKGLHNDLNALDQKLKQDRTKREEAVRDLGVEMRTCEDSCRRQAEATEYLRRIMALMLEGQRATNALSVQDYVDRSAERWLGTLLEAREPQPSLRASDLLSRMPGHTHLQDQDRVNFDVRKGFVADSYKPAPVLFKGKPLERKELLVLNHRLLEHAKSSLEFEGTPDKAVEEGAAGAVVTAAAATEVTVESARKAGKVQKLIKALPGEERRGTKGQQQGSQAQPEALGNYTISPEWTKGSRQKLPDIKVKGFLSAR